MGRCTGLSVYSLDDIFDAYNNYQGDAKDEILDFMSELTGISIDRLIELMNTKEVG